MSGARLSPRRPHELQRAMAATRCADVHRRRRRHRDDHRARLRHRTVHELRNPRHRAPRRRRDDLDGSAGSVQRLQRADSSPSWRPPAPNSTPMPACAWWCWPGVVAPSRPVPTSSWMRRASGSTGRRTSPTRASSPPRCARCRGCKPTIARVGRGARWRHRPHRRLRHGHRRGRCQLRDLRGQVRHHPRGDQLLRAARHRPAPRPLYFQARTLRRRRGRPWAWSARVVTLDDSTRGRSPRAAPARLRVGPACRQAADRRAGRASIDDAVAEGDQLARIAPARHRRSPRRFHGLLREALAGVDAMNTAAPRARRTLRRRAGSHSHAAPCVPCRYFPGAVFMGGNTCTPDNGHFRTIPEKNSPAVSNGERAGSRLRGPHRRRRAHPGPGRWMPGLPQDAGAQIGQHAPARSSACCRRQLDLAPGSLKAARPSSSPRSRTRAATASIASAARRWAPAATRMLEGLHSGKD